MKRYLVFALVVPFIGGFLLLLATTYQSGYWAETNAAEVAKLFAVFFKTLQFAYLFGFMPALMFGAVDDILCNVKKIGPVLRMLLVGLIAFFAAALTYASRGAEAGLVQFLMYGLVGFVPAVIASWLVHKYVEEGQPVASST
ncbi:MAG: DUF5413 family protein [Bradyrhizobium sp.]|uniref:DUF5413 family protein n=1 Tax=Bradyrhizobium sp. TaxID=376 RepID=UPI0025C31B3F|nr:DUF5413 family protein [Bradyrhizobium sp.]MBI5262098.1 DUF5413 family protein [Bradyrhizobium sp.]